MCMNCGCNLPNNRHGRDENITMDDLRRAADVNGTTVRRTVETIRQTLKATEPATASGTTSGKSAGR